MFKKLLLSAAAVAAFAAPASAAIIVNNITSASTISNLNDYKSNLNGLGLNAVATSYGSVTTDSSALIEIYYKGSESANANSITVNGTTYTETDSPWVPGLGTLIGSFSLAAGGDLSTMLSFQSSGTGTAFTFGSPKVGIFVPTTLGTSYAASDLYVGFEDIPNYGSADMDYDDFVIRISTDNTAGGVPEPATWAMMIMGFGLVGLQLRRRPTAVTKAIA